MSIGLTGIVADWPGRRLRTLAALLCLALLPTACGVGDWFESKPVFSMSWVTLEAAPDANGDRPVPVDLVILFDEGLVDTLARLPAREWFARRPQFERDFPDGFTVLDWELVPGQIIPPTEIPDDRLEHDETGARAVAAFVFADYATPGEHRARVVSQQGVRIRLGPDTFTLEELRPPQ